MNNFRQASIQENPHPIISLPFPHPLEHNRVHPPEIFDG